MLGYLRQRRGEWLARRNWDGGLPPPHDVKRMVIRRYARRHGVKIFVETGTYLGDMVAGVQSSFNEIHTIELSEELAGQAQERFRSSQNIHVYQGDSATVLPTVLEKLAAPALFWLDAHYSAGITVRGARETPIEAELQILVSHPFAPVILIDDACDFGSGDYPSIAFGKWQGIVLRMLRQTSSASRKRIIFDD